MDGAGRSGPRRSWARGRLSHWAQPPDLLFFWGTADGRVVTSKNTSRVQPAQWLGVSLAVSSPTSVVLIATASVIAQGLGRQVGLQCVLINGSLPGKCHHWGVGRTSCPCPALNPGAEPRRNLFPLEPPCPSPQGRGPAWWALLLHSVGWLPGSQPPGLAGGSLGLALREGECPGTSQVCVALPSPAVCLSGWGERSSALSHPGMMGCLTFLLIRRHGWLRLGLRILGTSLGEKGIS